MNDFYEKKPVYAIMLPQKGKTQKFIDTINSILSDPNIDKEAKENVKKAFVFSKKIFPSGNIWL